MASGGFAFRYPDFKEQAVAGQEEWKERTCFLLADQSWRDWSDKECTLTSGHAETALLWGDSFAAHYIPGIVRNAAAIPFNVIAYTAAGCPPIISYYSFARPQCQEFNRHALDLIKEYGVKTVILSGRWTSLKLRGVEEIHSTIDALRSMGVQTYVIGQSTEFGANVDVLDYRAGQIDTAAWVTNIDPGINLDLKAGMGDGATFVDPLAFLCQGELCPFKVEGVFRYSDFGHFSTEGATEAVKAYFPIVREKRPASRWRRRRADIGCGRADLGDVHAVAAVPASPAPRVTAPSPTAS